MTFAGYAVVIMLVLVAVGTFLAAIYTLFNKDTALLNKVLFMLWYAVLMVFYVALIHLVVLKTTAKQVTIDETRRDELAHPCITWSNPYEHGGLSSEKVCTKRKD